MRIHIPDTQTGWPLCGIEEDDPDGDAEPMLITCADCLHEQRRQRIGMGMLAGGLALCAMLFFGGMGGDGC